MTGRLKLFVATLLLSCITMTAKTIKEPDFAFPQDALASADSLLRVSRKNGDKLGVIRALMIKTVANDVIDHGTMQTSVDEVLKEAGELKDKQLKGLLQLYAANCVQSVYDNNRWQFNRRELPLTPRPEDMQEWSGEMFRVVVDSLCAAGWENAGDMKLKELTDIIDADELTLTYYPTLRDFAASRILNDAATSDSLRAHVGKEIVLAQRPDSPAYYMWKSKEIVDESQNTFSDLWKLYKGASDRYAALVVWQNIFSSVYLGSNDAKAVLPEIVERLKSDIADYPTAWITPLLTNRLNGLLQPTLEYQVLGTPCPDVPFKLMLNNIKNVEKVRLDFVRTPWSKPDEYNKSKDVRRSLTFNLGPKSVLPRDTVVEVSLPSGSYQVKVKLNGQFVPDNGYRYRGKIAVNAFVPVFAMSEKESVLTVIDSRTGKVVPGAAYVLKDTRDKVIKRGKADDSGRIVISESLRKTLRNVANYQIFAHGDTVIGREYLSNPGPREKDTQIRFTSTTDRGIYTPGDSVAWVIVAMNGDGTVASHDVSVKLIDSEGNVTDSLKLRTDAYGRISGKFAIPEDCRTGRFNLNAKLKDTKYYTNAGGFTVSDFKAAVAKIEYVYVLPNPVEKKGAVKGKVSTYSGMAVSNAEVLVNISIGNADEVVTINGLTDADGVFELQFNYPQLREDQSKYGGYGNADVTVTLPTGEVLTQTKYFNPAYPNQLHASIMPEDETDNIDILKPLRLVTTLTDGSGANVKATLGWKLKLNNEDRLDDSHVVLAEGTVESGTTSNINLPGDLKPGRYMLEVGPTDTLLAEPTRLYSTYYRTNTAQLPDSMSVIWMPSEVVNIDGKEAKVYIGVASDGTIVRCSYADSAGKLHFAEQIMAAGYDYFKFEVADTIVGQVTVYTVRNGNVSTDNLTVKKQKPTSPRLMLSSFRDKIFAGQSEKWSMTFTDTDGKALEGAVVLSVYDYRLDRLAVPQGLNVRQAQVYGGGMNFSWSWAYNYNVTCSLPFKTLQQTMLNYPKWKYSPSEYMLNMRLNSVRIRGTQVVGAVADYASEDVAVEAVPTVAYGAAKMMASNAMVKKESYDTALEESAVTVDEEGELAGAMDNGAAQPDFGNVELRDVRNFVAMWRPDMATDHEGKLSVDFKAPNSNTTWRVRGFAWAKDARMASVDTLLVASKPVMVSVNAPRFIRRGDTAILPVNVTNATDSTQQIAVKLEVGIADGPSFAEVERTVTLGARTSQIVDIDFTATAKAVPDSVGMIAVTARAICGGFSDGERVAMPVLASESRVTESVNFYMNPGEESVTLDVPRPTGSDFEAVLNFTANPMWTVVEALKVQKSDEVFSTSTSQAQSYFTSAVILGLMKQHPELELQFNAAELRSSMKKSMDVMKSLQGAQGGFRWGSWSSREDMYSTEAVLEVFAILKRAGMYDGSADAMIAKACDYADKNVWRKDASNIDVAYTIIRPAFGEINNVKGQKVVQNTINYILKNWKKQEPAEKALWASALWYSGNRNMARELLRSLTQFGTQTPQKGFEFKNVRSLHAYALLLEAYGTVEPASAEVDGIRQYLIVRRQGEAWERPYITDEIVRSMIMSGTPWVSKDTQVRVSQGSEKIAVAPSVKTGSFSVPVSGGAVTVSRGDATAPAYGAIVARYTSPSAEIKAFSDGEVNIEKRYVVRNTDGSWRMFDPLVGELTVGDRVKVQLTVKSSRPLSNVVVSDNRAATFEPVVQTSGWVYADGTSAYRENRDAVTNLYIDYLPQGTYILEYEVTANNAGSFSSGVADVTCTRAPDLTAHSSAAPIKVVPMSGR